jgi:hypothetical protein
VSSLRGDREREENRRKMSENGKKRERRLGYTHKEKIHADREEKIEEKHRETRDRRNLT